MKYDIETHCKHPNAYMNDATVMVLTITLQCGDHYPTDRETIYGKADGIFVMMHRLSVR